MSNLTIQPNIQNKNKRRKLNVKGTTLGCGTGMLAMVSSILPMPLIINGTSKLSAGLSKDEVSIVNKAADNVLSITKLGEKGIKIRNVKSGIKFEKPKWLKTDKVPEFIKIMLDGDYATAEGKSAFHGYNLTDEFQCISINRDKLSLGTFHELGHAYNRTNSNFWKTMQNLCASKYTQISSLALALIPLFTKKEVPKDGKELTKAQKFKNKLRNISPILAVIPMIPSLSEEAMASVRGCKWAKQLLSKDLYKKVVKSNIIAYISYLAPALGVAGFAYAGRKVKDYFADKASAKNK